MKRIVDFAKRKPMQAALIGLAVMFMLGVVPALIAMRVSIDFPKAEAAQ